MTQKISQEQLEGFLESLWPYGEQCRLTSHTRSFFFWLVCYVPDSVYNMRKGRGKDFANALRALADAAEEASMQGNEVV